MPSVSVSTVPVDGLALLNIGVSAGTVLAILCPVDIYIYIYEWELVGLTWDMMKYPKINSAPTYQMKSIYEVLTWK